MKPHTFIIATYLFLNILYATAQTTFTVNNTPNTVADFTIVQDAIDAAKDGDIIHIQPSTINYMSFKVTKRLSIYGRSHSLSGYTTSATIVYLTGQASGSRIEGINITEGIFESDNNTGNISNITIKNNKINGISLKSNANHNFDNITIIGNVLEGEENIFFDNNCSNVYLTNNIIGVPLEFEMSSNSVTIKNNIFYNYKDYNFTSKEGTLNISNCIFICKSKFRASVVFNNNGNQSKTIVKNCITYNYDDNIEGEYMFSGDEETKIIDCAENQDPLFINVNSLAYQGKFDPNKDDLHLQSNSPIKSAGVYSE